MTNHDAAMMARAILVTGGGYFDPDAIAAEIANGTFQVPTDDNGVDATDELADRLKLWVATAIHAMQLEEANDDPVALVADLVANAMMIQHRADLRAALEIGTASEASEAAE